MVPYTHSKLITGYGNATQEQKESRMQEIVESIQYTLNYKHCAFVYIFYQDALLIRYIYKQNLKYKEKLSFIPNMADTVSTLFEYANNYLVNKTVLVLNADTYPLEGFEKLNTKKLRDNKLVYLISR